MMNPVLRGAVIYLFLLVIFRVMGKRTLSQITTFDFVLLLIIGECTQQALLGEDYSMTNALVVIIALVGIDLLISFLKGKSVLFDRAVDGLPLILVEHGKVLKKRMEKVGVEVDDVMEAARIHQGLEHIGQVKFAVLERDGTISIIPWESSGKRE